MPHCVKELHLCHISISAYQRHLLVLRNGVGIEDVRFFGKIDGDIFAIDNASVKQFDFYTVYIQSVGKRIVCITKVQSWNAVDRLQGNIAIQRNFLPGYRSYIVDRAQFKIESCRLIDQLAKENTHITAYPLRCVIIGIASEANLIVDQRSYGVMQWWICLLPKNYRRICSCKKRLHVFITETINLIRVDTGNFIPKYHKRIRAVKPNKYIKSLRNSESIRNKILWSKIHSQNGGYETVRRSPFIIAAGQDDRRVDQLPAIAVVKAKFELRRRIFISRFPAQDIWLAIEYIIWPCRIIPGKLIKGVHLIGDKIRLRRRRGNTIPFYIDLVIARRGVVDGNLFYII